MSLSGIIAEIQCSLIQNGTQRTQNLSHNYLQRQLKDKSIFTIVLRSSYKFTFTDFHTNFQHLLHFLNNPFFNKIVMMLFCILCDIVIIHYWISYFVVFQPTQSNRTSFMRFNEISPGARACFALKRFFGFQRFKWRRVNIFSTSFQYE